MRNSLHVKLCQILIMLMTVGVVLGFQNLSIAGNQLVIQPNQIEIGTFFSGQSLLIQAEIPSSAQAIVEIVGQSSEEQLMKKGRRGGLWMNIGEVHVTGVPSLYIVASTESKLLEDPSADVSWGYHAIMKKIGVSGQVNENEKEKLIQDFIKLKEHYGVYKILPGQLKNSDSTNGHKKIVGTLPIPASIKPGTYEVCLTVIQQSDKQETTKQCQNMKVVMVGLPAILATLAYEHGALYGVIAVIIAILTGFAMGYIFKKGGGGH